MSDPLPTIEVVPLWRRLLRNRSVWISSGLLVLCGVVYVILFGSQEASLDRKGESVAKLSFLRNNVEIRYGGEYGWRKSVPDLPLLANDAIKTHENSAAMVEFGPQSFVKVAANSLLLVHKPPTEDEEVFEVVQGEFEATTNKPIQIKTPQGEMRIEPGATGLGRFEGRLDSSGAGEIRLLEGKSSLDLSGKSVSLSPGEVATLTDFRVAEVRTEVAPTVVGPPDRTTVELGSGKASEVEFQFGEAGKKYRIEVSDDPHFAKTRISDIVDGGKFQTSTLGEGTYYWRVAEVGDNGKRAAFTTPRRLSLEIPRQLPPSERGKFNRVKESALVVTDGADGVQVIRGTDVMMGDSAGGIREGDRLKMVRSGQGVLELGGENRVRLLDDANVFVNKVHRDSAGNVRTDLQLDQGGVLIDLGRSGGKAAEQTVMIDGRAYRFSNDAAKGEQSEVLLSRSGDGAVQVKVLSGHVRAMVGNEETKLASLDSLRVSRAGEFVAPKKEEIVDVILREGIASNVFYTLGLTLVAFEWSERGTETVFELARDPEFRKIESRQRVSQNRAVLAMPSVGTHYWRYKAGDFVSPVTQVGFFPAKDGKTGAFKVTVEKNEERVIFGSQPPVLTFKWKSVPGIARYNLEIFRDTQLSGRIYERQVEQGSEITFFADFLSEGDYWWRVSALDHKGKVVQALEKNHIRLDRNPLAPMVDIAYPEETLNTSERMIVARGMLLSDGDLSVNGQSVRSGRAGPFTVRLDLQDGINPIVFKEVGKDQRVSYYLRRVIVDGGKPK